MPTRTTTQNGYQPTEDGLNGPPSMPKPAGSGLAALAGATASNSLALTPSGGGSAGALSLSMPMGHSITREEHRIVEQTEEQVLQIHAQAAKLRVVLQEWVNVNQQVGINTAQTFALLSTLRHLSSDPDYQAWWSSWSRFEAERYANSTDELLVLGARVMGEILAQPVQPPGELVAWWRRLFGQ